jgi:hypothetical protein
MKSWNVIEGVLFLAFSVFLIWMVLSALGFIQ